MYREVPGGELKRIKIKALGVFDTVGMEDFLNLSDFQARNMILLTF